MWEQKPENKVACVQSCGKAPKEAVIYIDYYVLDKINILMKKFERLEWLAYLIGKDDVVDDLYLPKQKVTSTNVTDIEGNPEIEIIGVIHSHHHLGLHTFSGTDHAYINDNHALSVLVWHGGINGQKKITLPCGSLMIVPIKVEFFHRDINVAEFEKEIEDNIAEKTYVYVPLDQLGYNVPPTRHVGVQHLTKAEQKKNTGSCADRNTATGKNDAYEDYLDQLVYDGEMVQETCAEDMGDERSAKEIADHFELIDQASRSAVAIQNKNIKAKVKLCGDCTRYSMESCHLDIGSMFAIQRLPSAICIRPEMFIDISANKNNVKAWQIKTEKTLPIVPKVEPAILMDASTGKAPSPVQGGGYVGINRCGCGVHKYSAAREEEQKGTEPWSV